MPTQLTAKQKVDWAWALGSTSTFHSELSITDKNKTTQLFEFQCNLKPSIAKVGQNKLLNKDGSTTIKTVVTKTHPNGLLLIICPIGAHSKQVTIINPNAVDSKVLLQKTGSYSAGWKLIDQRLRVYYDAPSKYQQENSYETQFETIFIQLPLSKE